MSSATSEELLALLTPGSPLGPASADDLQSRRVAQALYDPRNEIDGTLRRTSPVFLIGRRGSGKTAVLQATYPEGELDVKLDSPSLIDGVARTLEALNLKTTRSFAELIVPLWRGCFTTALTARVWSDYCRLTENDCPLAFEFGRAERKTPVGYGTDAALRFLHAVRARAGDDYVSIDTLLDETEINGVKLWEAREDLHVAARRNGCQAMISMDSLDSTRHSCTPAGP